MIYTGDVIDLLIKKYYELGGTENGTKLSDPHCRFIAGGLLSYLEKIEKELSKDDEIHHDTCIRYIKHITNI